MMKSEFQELLPLLTYGGERMRLCRWGETTVSRTESGDEVLTVREFTSPDALLGVRSADEEFRDFPVLRRRYELIGIGGADSQTVSEFDVVGFSRPLGNVRQVTVRALRGSKNSAADFAGCVFTLSEDGQTLDFCCDEGRSSANWMPCFGFDFDETEGAEVAIGWSGAWRLQCGISGGSFFCRAWMRDLATVVRPGETLRQPSVLYFRRAGMTVREFQTVIHDFMVKYNSPRDGRGVLQKPILPIGASGGNHPTGDIEKVIDYAVRAGLPCDALWVDAGWNGPEHHPDTRTNCGDCWSRYVGDWRVNTGVHPSGTLKSVSRAAHTAGMRFLLWFEPERVMENTPVFREHPEFIYPTPVLSKKGVPRYLLDLGSAAAWQWAFDTLSKVIRENGVDIYRQDFNLDPASVWAASDDPGRRGVSEIRHISGLYRLWDALRAEFPNLLIDNCASGGRRLDFELVGRSHVYCRSDYLVPRANNLSGNVDYTPEFHRAQIVLGQNATLNTLAWVPFQMGEANGCTLFDDAEFFSLLASGIVFSAPDWAEGSCKCAFGERETSWFRRMLRVADRMRQLTTGRFYPLTEARTTSEEEWAAYELFMSATGEGAAVFFRRSRAPERRSFELRWIDAAARYLVEEAAMGELRELGGAELGKLTVTIPLAPGARVIFFRRAQ